MGLWVGELGVEVGRAALIWGGIVSLLFCACGFCWLVCFLGFVEFHMWFEQYDIGRNGKRIEGLVVTYFLEAPLSESTRAGVIAVPPRLHLPGTLVVLV